MNTSTTPQSSGLVIPESQFEIWSHQGAIDSSKKTYASIRYAIEHSAVLVGRNYEVFLQGSYGNDTNIRSDSDVDVTVKLKDAFWRDLSGLGPLEQDLYQASFFNTSYGFTEFRGDVLKALTSHYGSALITPGRNSLKVKAASGRLGSDVVVCLEYRKYRRFYGLSDQLYVEGLAFLRQDGMFVVNYPKLHSQNCTQKNKTTSGWFKPTVRIFKNMRSRLEANGVIAADIAPSYFIENLLHNVPEACFAGSYSSTLLGATRWLFNAELGTLMCANGQIALFGNGPDQWTIENCQRFLVAVVGLLLGE